MNRVVLVGNGYDLSCGLPTSYENFIIDYFKSALTLVVSEKEDYSDELIRIQKGYWVGPGEDIELINSLNTIEDLSKRKDISFNPKPHETPKEPDTDFLGLTKQYQERPTYYKFHITYNSNLFRELLKDYKWTDIESSYFNLIKNLRQDASGQKQLKQMNKELSCVKKKLRDYIKKVEEESNDKIKDFNGSEKGNLLSRCTQLTKGEVYEPFYSMHDMAVGVDKVLFINFNYTSVLKEQLEMTGRWVAESYGELAEYRVENIHGCVKEKEEIVFGYGDENQQEYQILENSEINEYLVNIKSFYYALNDKYRKILNFISDGKYDVFCIGHSLGVSDRILLKTILENENCSLIRLFHRGNKNSFFKSVISLSRHFNDKSELRKKLLAYNEDDVIKSYPVEDKNID
jgi:hypothetical protein